MILEILGTIGGTGAAVLATLILILITRFILNRSVEDKRSLPYHRQIFTLVISLIGLFVAIALLPFPPDVTAQILSVLGILLSAVVALSSTTFVGNAMSGIMLRLMKGFRAGDFIRFDDVLGRVADVSLFHTEVQLITRDIVTVPNSLLTKRAVQVTRRSGTFVATVVSIGYTEPSQRVEALLKSAAEAVGLSEPFVMIDSLLDHAIRYRVYGLLEQSSELLTKTSDLNRAVLKMLHGDGIEIASPALVDRREFGGERGYFPSREAAPAESEEPPSSESIEEIAFDRAEEAESIEELYALQEKLARELKSDGGDKQRAQTQLDRIQEEIRSREERQQEQRLDEDAPKE